MYLILPEPYSQISPDKCNVLVTKVLFSISVELTSWSVTNGYLWYRHGRLLLYTTSTDCIYGFTQRAEIVGVIIFLSSAFLVVINEVLPDVVFGIDGEGEGGLAIPLSGVEHQAKEENWDENKITN